MDAKPWFRFYHEALNDRKLLAASATLRQPKALIIGVWVTLLALANDSPERGVLRLTVDVPVGPDDLARETGLDVKLLAAVLREFQRLQMLDTDEAGTYHITHWGKRQYESDSSSDRVRRYREKELKRSGNVSETPTEAEAEAEAEAEYRSRAKQEAALPLPELLPLLDALGIVRPRERHKAETALRAEPERVGGWLLALQRPEILEKLHISGPAGFFLKVVVGQHAPLRDFGNGHSNGHSPATDCELCGGIGVVLNASGAWVSCECVQ